MINIDILLDIEKRNELYDKRIYGYPIWLFLRTMIWEKYTKGYSPEVLAEPTSLNKTNLSLLALLLVNTVFPRKSRVKKPDIIIFCHPRRIREKGVYKCIYTEFLSEYFSNNSITIEEIENARHLIPVNNNNLLYMDSISLITGLLVNLHLLFKTALYANILKQVQNILDIGVDAIEASLKKTVKREVFYLIGTRAILTACIMGKLLRRLLLKYDPKIIIEVVSYSQRNMIMNIIAKEQGIKTVELQHGTIFPNETDYCFSEANVIPTCPDYILTFSDYFSGNIRNATKKSKIISTGFPYYEIKKDEAIKKRRHKNTSQKTILFLSQPKKYTRISEVVLSLGKKIDRSEYRIIFKIHPAEYNNWREIYPHEYEKTVKVVAESDMYELFCSSDYQVGSASMALFEGMGFGLPTFVLKEPNSEGMKGMEKLGFVRFFNDEWELLEMIKTHNESKKTGEQIFKLNAKHNIINVLNELLNEK